jgi:hypothetical protein
MSINLIHLGMWDILLLLAVSAQAGITAYLYHPKWKALLLSLPIPFTLATLCVGQPINATNVIGLIVLLIFIHGVRFFYCSLRWPILASIIISALGYCLISIAIRPLIPISVLSFWLACGGTFLLAGVVFWAMPFRPEPGHRTPLPVWLKLPAIILVILFLIMIKKYLGGFMTVFPMVGVITAYEARHSLWTICRQIPAFILFSVPMMATCYLLQNRVGMGWALLAGWVVLLSVGSLFTRWMWKNDERFLLQNPVINEKIT